MTLVVPKSVRPPYLSFSISLSVLGLESLSPGDPGGDRHRVRQLPHPRSQVRGQAGTAASQGNVASPLFTWCLLRVSVALCVACGTCNQGFGAGAGVFGWSRSRHFGPAPAPP